MKKMSNEIISVDNTNLAMLTIEDGEIIDGIYVGDLVGEDGEVILEKDYFEDYMIDVNELICKEMINYIINSGNYHIPNPSYSTINEWFIDLSRKYNSTITKKDDFFDLPYDILKDIYLKEYHFNEKEGIII